MKGFAKVPAAALGGFFGGAVVGFLEAIVVAWAGGAEEFGVFSFGALSYGLIGAVLGGGIGIGTLVVSAFARDTAAAAGLSAGTVAALLGLAVARFRIVRDLFNESLPIASGAGLAVHLGLLVSAILVLLGLRRLVIALAGRGSGFVATGAMAASTVLIGFLASAVLNATAVPEAVVPPPGTAQGPSAILILVDTLRADHIGAYGSTTTKTPAMDRLAKDGVIFENAFAQSSWTRPSVATVLTSLYPSSHRVMYKTDLLPTGVTTIAELLEEAGYRTTGHVTNINVAPSFHFEQGFQEYSYLAPKFFFGATDSGSKLAFYSGMRLLRERFLSREKWVEHYYQDAQTVNGAALPWLDRNGREPFFAFIHYMDPHDPYFEIPYNGVAVARVDTPNPDPSQRDRLMELYSSNIEYFDGFLRNLIEALEAAGNYENTMIVLVADHGEEFYEHGGWWHGTTLYEEEVRVPILVKLPKNAKAGTRVREWAQLLDVAPTIAAALGVQPVETWQGRDLFSGAPAPAALFAEEDHEGNILHSIRSDRWKMIVANEGNPRGLAPVELYDMVADPRETENVAGRHPEVVKKLEGDLEALKIHAAAGAVEGASGAIDEASQERLRALGYLQ